MRALGCGVLVGAAVLAVVGWAHMWGCPIFDAELFGNRTP
ncbi:hypothetical protein SEA_SCHOOLBUS_65 [Mycobacterium phage SchoolBus]|nr:hypothetical protein SEA_SCHOOLBUS_65 [Mycobacterium phage SchoolBus]